MPISESGFTGFGTGLSLRNQYVIIEIMFADFLSQNFDQIFHQITKIPTIYGSYINLPVLIRTAGFAGNGYGPTHSSSMENIFFGLPNLDIFSPSGLWEVDQATKSLSQSNGPGFLRLDKSFGQDFHTENEKFEIGKGRILSEGMDCSIILTGGILEEAELAKNILEKNNISTQIISMHTIKPLDDSLIVKAIKSSKLVVTLEEHTIIGGLGSAVCEVIVDNQLQKKPVIRIGLESGFTTIVGSQKYLRAHYKMDSNAIVNRILKFFGKI